MDQPNPDQIPDFETLAADPEIAPLLAFDPVIRKVKRPNGWTPELQRELIARLAATGTLQQAVWQMDKHATGAENLYKSPSAASFRLCWDAALIIGRRRNHLDPAPPFTGQVPGIARRVSKSAAPAADPHSPDPQALARQYEDARDSIGEKLRGCRRLYLQEISACPGKRAAFEILTQLPIDWDKAARLEPQPDEPWRRPNMREPDMLLTAENGWMGGMAHGPDKQAELRAQLDKYHEEQGLEPIKWGENESDDSPTSSSPTQIGDPASPPEQPSSSPGPRLRGCDRLAPQPPLLL
jgi:hypothetical protein